MRGPRRKARTGDARSGPAPPDDATTILSGHATVRQWRRIALERQLPQPHFPGGLGVPSVLTLLLLVLIGGATLVYFALPAPRAVPHALLRSQRDLVGEIAHRLSVRAWRDRADAEALASRYRSVPPAGQATFAPAALASHTGWHSVAVWDQTTGRTVTSGGEALPPNVLKATTDSYVAVGYLGTDQRGRLVHVVRLPDGKMLGVAVVLGIRNLRLEPSASQTVAFVLNQNTLIYSQGRPIAGTDPVRPVIVKAAAARATHTELGRSVTVGGHPRVPVVSAAPVADTGFSVVSVTYAQRTTAAKPVAAAALGGALVVVAFLGYAWIRIGFVRPLRRLLGDSKAVACGEVGGGSRVSHLREAHRLGAALSTLSLGHPSGHRRSRRLRVGATTVVSATLVAVVVWSVALFVVVGDASTIPAQIVADYQNHADDAANALRDTIDTGLDGLRDLAATAGGNTAMGRPAPALLDGFLKDNSRFRTVYVLGPDWTVRARSGHPPLRRSTWPGTAPGVVLDGRNRAFPLVLAHVPYGTGQFVAEFDANNLRSVLGRVAGHVSVVDRQARSMLDTGGIIAFRTVPDRAVQAAALRAGTGTPAATNSNRRLVVASPVGTDAAPAAPGATANAGADAQAATASPAATLRWVVVVTRDVTDFALPTTQALHVAWLLVVLAITVAITCWGWQYVIFVRPLRALVALSERVSEGEHHTAISPQRFDEIGALAMCLEICRQTRNEGIDRVAGAVRLRGAGDNYTAVFPTIKTR